jgi:hypothetical protein
MLTRALKSAAILAAVLLMVACGDKVTDESFDRVATGMTLSEVQGILGKGEQDDSGGLTINSSGVMGSSNAANSSRQTFFWKNGDRQIIVEFKDLKVVSKRKLGF